MLTIVIPVYNEEDIIENTLNRLTVFLENYNKDFEILVVDDGSSDSTVEIVGRASQKNRKIRLVKHEKNIGIGGGLRTGLKNAKGDIIITMDSDLTYPPEDIPKLIDGMKSNNADMVIGTPYTKGGDRSNIPLLRFILSRGINLVDQILFRLNFTSPTSFFRAWTKETANNVEITFDRFEAVSESAVNAHRKGYKIVEVPVKYRSVEGRQSRLKILPAMKKHIEMDLKLLFKR